MASNPLEEQVKFLASEESTNPQGDEIAKDLATIVDEIDKQERITRDRMLRLWKYLDLLWTGSGNYYWDHLTGQWAAITQEDIALLANEADIDPTLINKVINLIRPYGESLIGVLTTGVPKVKYFPADADKEVDIQASKGYENVEQKVSDDNFMNLRLVEMILQLWNGGFAAVYNYPHSDKKYGTFHEDVMGNRKFNRNIAQCMECENEDIQETEVDEAEDEIAPDADLTLDEDLTDTKEETEAEVIAQVRGLVEGQENPEEDIITQHCEVCGTETDHILYNDSVEKETVVGTKEIPKSRQIIRVFGPMRIKIPALARYQEDIPWLILEEEIHVSTMRHLYPEHRDKIQPQSDSDIDIDRIARTSYEVSDDTLKNYVTRRMVWLRPAAFEILEQDKQKINFYKENYPSGVKIIFSGEDFLEAEEEDLDDHWTISENPLYDKLQADPLGKALIGLHETAGDLFQLEVDTVRYAIPDVYADPQYFDFEAHRQSRKLPGSIKPMKRPPGGRLQDAIAETRTATIPKEVENLDSKVEKLLQFISGVLPPVFGGPGSGSKTLGEYQESKNQALQRLSIIWKIISVLYARVMAKATKNYIDNLLEDELYVRETGPNTFMNVWIKRATFSNGSIGEVRPELSEQFPSTWGQISARVMELLGLNNEVITSWLLHPENIELIYKSLGLQDLHVPNEEQRNKQLHEISQLIISEPTISEDMVDEMTGEPMIVSSVPIEPIDNDEVHMVVVAAFLNSPMGIDLKQMNFAAYQNVLLHYQEHEMRIIQMQQQQVMEQEATEENSKRGSNLEEVE